MIRSRIDLIGGGPGTLKSLRHHLRATLPPPDAKGRKPLVAYVGAASGDDAGFFKMIGGEIVLAGGRASLVRLASQRAKLSAATGLLEDCDVVFVSGGDVQAGMNVLEQRGVLPLFHALGTAGRPMIGISAGSIMLGRAWVHFPDHDGEGARRGGAGAGPKSPPTCFPCLGLAPVYVDAHAEEDRWAELKVLLSLLLASGERDPVGYGLTREGGISVEAVLGGTRLLPFGTPTPRFLVKNRRVIAGTSLPAGAMELIGASSTVATPRRRARRS